MANPAKSARHTKLVQLVHIGKNTLSWDDGTYRDVLYRFTGKTSSSLCKTEELDKVLEYIRSQGFEPSRKKYGCKPNVAIGRKQILSKIEALLADAKRSWSYVESMGRQMFDQPIMEWLTTEQLQKIMQALIIDASRRRGQNGS